MPTNVVQKLIEKGWSEEEINQYLYLTYKDSKKSRAIKKDLAKLRSKTDMLLLIVASIVFGLFFIVFTIFQIEYAAIPLVILLSVFIELKLIELLGKSASFIKSVGITTGLISIILIASRITYSAFMKWKRFSPIPPNQILIFLIVGIAGAALTGLFISLLERKNRENKQRSFNE